MHRFVSLPSSFNCSDKPNFPFSSSGPFSKHVFLNIWGFTFLSSSASLHLAAGLHVADLNAGLNQTK